VMNLSPTKWLVDFKAGAISLGLAASFMLAQPIDPAIARAAPESFADLAEEMSPAVVNISSTQKVDVQRRNGLIPNLPPGSPLEEFFRRFGERGQGQEEEEDEEPIEREARSLGSGFVIDPDGYIVTNHHVIDGADTITVQFDDESEFEATLVGSDSETDVALLKITGDDPFPYVKFGNSDDVRVGDWVMAIGNPFGLGGSVTAGILSARHRNINATAYDDFLQTDASINRGNSGGPMFNMDGQVIGVNTAIFSPTGGNVGIGFAIPSNMVQRVVGQLREFGRAKRGWLGVVINAVTKDIAQSLGMEKARGAIIASVNENSPADKAGFKPGDVVLKFAGEDVKDNSHLVQLVGKQPVGETIRVRVLRDDKEVNLRVKLGERPLPEDQVASAAPSETPDEVAPASVLGMNLRSVTSDMLEQMELPDDIGGVAVIDVKRSSDAGRKGLSPGDVIVQVNGKSVATPEEVEAQVAAAEKQGRPTVLLRLFRNGTYFHTAVKADS